MAEAIPTSIQQLEHEFHNRIASLPESQRVKFWLQAVSALSSNASNSPTSSLAQQTPRTMAYSSTDMTQLPTSTPASMGYMQPSFDTVPLSRSVSVSSMHNMQQSSPPMSNWQSSYDEQPSTYTLFSESASQRRQPSLQTITETPTLFSNGMIEYTPDEFVNNFTKPSDSPSQPFSQPQHPQLHISLTPNAQWSPTLEGSTSPSTLSPAMMTPVTQSSNSMSRQSSFNPSIYDQEPMLRVQSDSSSMLPLILEDGSFSFTPDVESKSISSHVDNHFLSNFTGPPSESFLSPAHISTASASGLAFPENQPYLVEDMKRSVSLSSESGASDASASSAVSRHARREREINAQAGRCKIAPKADPSNIETRSASSNVKMMRIQSDDGSSKNVGVITKAPYTRPQHPKIMCPHCNDRPDGFRGTHELDRHVARAHNTVRKGFICIDDSPNKDFLAGCKHCRTKKVYGAYYNAAAHLRRAHFHPRKRGRKGKHDEKRGGIGGGDDPPMDFLRQSWIREVQVENKPSATSPESFSDSAEPADINNSYGGSYEADLSYDSTSQPTNDVSMSIDNSIIDYSMCMSESEPMYNSTMIFSTSEPNLPASDTNYSFDAYRTY